MDTVGACAPCRKAGCCHAAMPSPVKKCTGRLSGSVLSRVPGTRTTSDCKAIGAAAPFFTCQNRIALHGSRRECARDPCRTGRFDHAATSLPDVQGPHPVMDSREGHDTAHRGISAVESLSQEIGHGGKRIFPTKSLKKACQRVAFLFIRLPVPWHQPSVPCCLTTKTVVRRVRPA